VSLVNLLANDDWSEADILARVRAEITTNHPQARQEELQTIMIGHIAGLRTASPAELAEIMGVKAATEAGAVAAQAARADMALLREVWSVERGAITFEAASASAKALHAQRNPVGVHP
jgi:hypothetical protein